MRYRRLRKRIKLVYDGLIKKLILFLVKTFYIRCSFNFWKNQIISEIDNWQVNSQAWDITLEKLKRLNKKTSFWVIKDTYWHSYKISLKPTFNNYKNKLTKIEAINEHLEGVKFLYEQEKKRQENIDTKAKQILSNAGIILTIFGALSTVIISNGVISQSTNIYGSVIVFLLLISSLLIAIYVLDFKKYNRPTSNYLLEPQNYVKETFMRERVLSYIIPTEFNIATNTKKTKQLKFATVLFGLALLLVTILLCINIIKWSSQTKSDKVHNVNIINESLEMKSNCCCSSVPNIQKSGYLYFEFNKHFITPLSAVELNKIVLELETNLELNIYITGHADFIGNSSYNKNLSELRAKEVRSYLIKKGIKESRITIDFYGETQSIDSKKTKIAAGVNRRVEWIIK